MTPTWSKRKLGAALAVTVVTAVIACAFIAPRPSLAGPTAAPVRSARLAAVAWSTVNVELPGSDVEFPAGEYSDLANVQCLICHSAGMVLRQPPLTKDQWRAEVVKMGAVFGALVPADQVEPLTEYLFRINGR